MLIIVIFNRSLRTKPKNTGIIQSIAASEAGEKSRVTPGYCQGCCEASLAGDVHRLGKRKNQTGRKVCYTIAHVQHKRIVKMSCFQLSDRHHASIAHYVAECEMWPDSKIQEFADKLKRCNIASVNYRYERQTPARKCKIERRQYLDAKAYYDAIRCWAYQSCDNPGNVDYDILRGFLFSLAHPGYSTDMPVDQWGIN